VRTMKVKKAEMRRAAAAGFINATDLADYLTRKGMPFRTAYRIVGQIVAQCIATGHVLEDLPLEAYREHSDLFEQDLFADIDLEQCARTRTSEGGTAPESVERQLALLEDFLNA